MKVVALAGGVGGAKLADGLSRILPEGSLTVIVNTGDDFDHLGLRICPDLDTVCYTLAGLANPATGWGRDEETWHAMESLEQLGGPIWFRLGDLDLGTHLERTRLLADGLTLSEVTKDFCKRWGVKHNILPMSNDRTPTLVHSDIGQLNFQDYFVKLKCEPQVSGFQFANIESAHPAPGVLESLQSANLVVICPSNPWVSIDPILAVPGIKEAAMNDPGGKQIVAISPIIAGASVKGPAAKMYAELGFEPSALSVAKHYGAQKNGGLLTGYVFDILDGDLEEEIQALGLSILVINTVMKTSEDKIELAKEVVALFDSQDLTHIS
jgi:LPPG:FO 2-phospho-L-lactate transferase